MRLRLFISVLLLVQPSFSSAIAASDDESDVTVVPMPREDAPPVMAPPQDAAPAGRSSGNISNDKLLTMPEHGRVAMLSKATHFNCIGKKPFFMGVEKHPNNLNVALWSLTCANGGQEYLIAIAPDAVGSTRVISCSLLRKEPWKCYEKLEESK